MHVCLCVCVCQKRVFCKASSLSIQAVMHKIAKTALVCLAYAGNGHREQQSSMPPEGQSPRDALAALLLLFSGSVAFSPEAGRHAFAKSRPAGLDAQRLGQHTTAMSAKVGEPLPSVEIYVGNPPRRVNIADRVKGKRVLVVGLPGAFTPTSSSRQIPGYLSKENDLKAKGVAEVIVYSCNDAAVMKAWAYAQGAHGTTLTFMGDPHGNLTSALGVNMEHPGPLSLLGGPRCQRHALYVEDGIIKDFEVAASEDDPAGDDFPDVTLVENMLTKVPELDAEEREKVMAAIEEEKKKAVEATNEDINSSDLVLFVRERCLYCREAFGALDKKGFKPKVVLAKAFHRKGLLELTGKRSLPSAWVKGTYMGGCNEVKKLLDAQTI